MEKRFDLVVRLTDEKRQGLSDVQNLLIATPNGYQIPLSQVAEVEIINGPNQIQREDAKRRIVVGFNVRGRDKSIVERNYKVKTQIKFALDIIQPLRCAFLKRHRKTHNDTGHNFLVTVIP
jgi:cobalt-zinc-cadmium resistance protein CzcA